MIRLTLMFKGRLLAVFQMSGDQAVVGRERDCDIPIDSLAVAPRHARLTREGEGATLTALDAEHPVFCNGQRIASVALADLDLIQIGKHTLSVALGEDPGQTLARPLLAPGGRRSPLAVVGPGPAYVQVQSGPAIGRVIRFKRAVTRLTRIGGTEVIVTRQAEGYRVTRIGEANEVVVDGRVLEGSAEVLLGHRARIEVDGTRCQFFDPAADAVGPAAPPGEGPEPAAGTPA